MSLASDYADAVLMAGTKQPPPYSITRNGEIIDLAGVSGDGTMVLLRKDTLSVGEARGLRKWISDTFV